MNGADDDDGMAATVGLESLSGTRPILPRGSSIDRYMVVDQLGEGGMGVVYRAYDPELDRPVAIKLLRAVGAAPAVLRDRLMREAQALARLSHPNVITVHDVGTFGDDVFVAMEFVEGQTLRAWLRAGTRTAKEVLDVFLAAGAGLAAAHRASLVHRDFKPDNVMVGNDGRVHVLDFGLVRVASGESATPAPATPDAQKEPVTLEPAGVAAAASSVGAARLETATPSRPSGGDKSGSRQPARNRLHSSLTLASSIVGTPRYMAPEQHRSSNADERADQFSFCVSLYEAVYARLPFAGDSLNEYADNVMHGRIEEPPPGATVPRWLRQVLLRGLSTDPAARFPSMNALLSALRADPSLARARWWRRAAPVMLVAGLVLAWQLSLRKQGRACAGADAKLAGVWDPARRAAVRDAFARSHVPYAGAAFSAVEHAFDDYARAWIAMRADSCEATYVRHEQSQELLDLRMSCLDDRLTQLETLTNIFAGADAKLVERAAQSAQSLPSLESCADAAVLRAPIAPPPDTQTRRRVDEVRQQLAQANALWLAARYDEGLLLIRGLLREVQALRYKPIDAEAQLRLGQLLGDHGDYAESTAAYLQALAAALSGHHDEAAARAAIELIQSIGLRQARYDEADRWAQLAESLVDRIKHNDELSGLFFSRRARLRVREDKYEDALADATRALEIKQRAFGPDHYSVADAHYEIGYIKFEQADYSEALEQFRRCLAIQQRTMGPDHPLLVNTMIAIASVYAERGQHEQALAQYQKVLATVMRSRPDYPNLGVLHYNLSSQLNLLGRGQEAVDEAKLAIDTQVRFGPSFDMSVALNTMGEALLSVDRPEEALRYFTQSLETCERVLAHGHDQYGQTLADMGEAYRREGRLDEALPRFERALEITEKALGPKHPRLAQPLLGIARVALSRHSTAARAPLERALAIREAQPADGVELADIRFALAQALWTTDEHERAVQLATQARDGYEQIGAVARKPLAETTGWLARRR